MAFLGNKATFTINISKGSREQLIEKRATFIIKLGDIYILL